MLKMILFILLLPGTLELLLLNMGIIIWAIKKRTAHYYPLSTALLIPAHNEEKLIGKTLASLKELTTPAKIFVIADRCTDQTAVISEQASAEVIKNENDNFVGKGGALWVGLNYLSKLSYERIGIIDADTLVSQNLIEELQQGEAAQALHHLVEKEGVWNRLQRIKFRAACSVRPKARAALGFSAGILGNGFAFTKELEKEIPFEVNSVTEDLQYHIKLVLAQKKVLLAEKTSVQSEIPPTKSASSTQSSRWEKGRFVTAYHFVTPLFKSLIKGNFLALEPLLDLLLLPLSYHIILVLLAYYIGVPWAGFMLLMIVIHLASTFIEMKASYKDYIAFLFSPFFIVWKLGVLLKVIAQKKLKWTPTER